MINFDFKRTNRKCSVSGRVFSSGEEYVSVLVDEDGELIRRDISKDGWQDPPENCIGWWMSRIPDLEKGTVYWAPKDVLLSIFQHFVAKEQDKDTIYVMAILLLQKKFLRLLDKVTENELEIMHVVSNSTKEKYDIEITSVTAERIKAIQDELAEKLFTDVAPTED